MATTTPNYGWAVPTSTDLVKDGATAIETLGDAIDASMNTALGTKKAGMVLLNTTSFSAVASQSINDVFSTTYDNYLLLVEGVGSSASSDLNFRLRVGGADASGATDYVRPALYNAQNSSTVANAGGAASSSGYLGFTSNDRFVTNATFFNPFLARRTFENFQNYGANYQVFGATRHALTTSYTGLTLIIAAGTMTGVASIYGFNK
jgi:hypothetical protein